MPVGDVITNKNESTIHIILGRHTFASNGNKTLIQSAENWSDTSSKVAINTYYKELANSNYGNKAAKNLEGFVTKALTSGGYYIGRYEAGDATATKSERTSSSSDTNPLVFIQEFSGDTDYSRQNRLQSSLAKCGEATDETNKDVRCNIYDMAGNTRELTTETYSLVSAPCVDHGGSYSNTSFYTSHRFNIGTTINSDIVSFRQTLYL